MQKALEVTNLVKRYGKFTAVDGVSFSIESGEIFALIGPNGAGKSTILKTISTILKPTSGSIKIFDHDVVKDSDKVREIISYLPEEAGAYKNMTGNAYLDLMANLYAIDLNEKNEFIQKAIEVSKLGEKLKEKINTYSKGMTRRLLIARTIMSKPKLTILDEPTSGLDVRNALEVRKIIKEMSKNGMAVLLSSHNMLETEFLSDRVGIIDCGKIIEVGTADSLKKEYNASNLEEVFEKIT